MTIIIQRPTLILKDEENIIKISRASVKAIPMVSAHPYFKKVRNWKHIAVHYMSQPENQQEVILFDGSQSEPEGILAVSPRAYNIFILEAIVLHDYDNGWLTIPKELILEANDMELVFDSRYRQPNIDAVIQNKSNALITWDAAKETGPTTVYNVFRKEGSGAYSQVATITGTRSYVNTGLLPDITYTYKVEINDPTKYIPPTDSASVTPVRPATPINLKATTTPGQVTTTWNPIVGSGVTYRLFRSTASDIFTDPAIATGLTGNTYTDTAVVAGTIYYYMVKAFDGFESLPSAQVSIKPIGTFSITNVVPLSTTSVRVEFSLAAGADSYDLYYKNSNASAYITIAGVVSPRVVTGLSEGETYQFYATAKNPYSSYTTGIVTETLPKTAGVPTNFTATQWLDGIVKLKWNSAFEADTYLLYKSLSSTGTYTKIATLNGLFYDDTDVSNGTTYYYKLSAVNLHEDLEIEGFKTGTISGYPNKVIANLTKASGTTVTKTPITYTAYTNAPASMVNKFEIKHFDKLGNLLSTMTSTAGVATYTPATLQLNLYTQYAAYVTVYVSNQDGSQVAQSSTVYYITAANIPTMKSYISTFDDVTVKWQTGIGNDSYILYRSTKNPMDTGIVVNKYEGSALEFLDDTIPAGIPYYYAVQGKVLNGTWTGITIGLTLPPTSLQSEVSPISAPMAAVRRVYNRPEISLNIGGSQLITTAAPYSRTALNVTWSANSEYYNNLKILKSTDKITWTTPTISSNYDVNVTPGTTYYYKTEATEIKTGAVFSKILGAVPIDASLSAVTISGSISWATISSCYYDGNDQKSYKLYRVSFSWNKNPAYATYRVFHRESTGNTNSTHAYYSVANGNNMYIDEGSDQSQRDSGLIWYRQGLTEPDGTIIVKTTAVAYNSARTPSSSSYYAWYFGPLPKIPC